MLKLLQKHYHHKIKMIYIDPPYNTGKDFIYKDNFTEGKSDYFERIGATKNGIKLETNSDAHGRYHSQWLSMMYPRLFLAKQLLKDDGVIFISIDDNEQHHLKMLMNEVFGEENFLGNITVVGNPRGRDYGGIARMHDNLLVFSKIDAFEMNNLIDHEKVFAFHDEIGEFDIRELRNRNIAFNSKNRPNLYYPFYINSNNKDENGFFEISLDKKKDWIELYPKVSQGLNTVWRWGKPKSLKQLNINIIGKAMKDGGWQICEKYREKTAMARSVWRDKEVNTEKGTLLIKELLNGKYFDFPKPLGLIKRMVEMGTNENDIVLDFFAGSATTGHAVMGLNKQDSGNRKFILVQIPESVDEKSAAAKAGYKTISEISIERLKRAIDKNNYPTGFKVFSLAPSHYTINQSYDGDDEQALLAIEKSAIKNPLTPNFDPLDLAYEIALKQGFPLTSNIEKKDDFYTIIDPELERTLIITLAKKINTTTIETLKLTTDDILVCLDSALTDTQKVNFSRNFNLRVI
ncbi:Type III restriction-modification system methylation subunit [uncultured Candidatus Thioglobus sp.]|nr:Type III restriction-modification system methylation subunit [uncultured Candidatus Thioglobus sp.]